jgi:hypothetical protein
MSMATATTTSTETTAVAAAEATAAVIDSLKTKKHPAGCFLVGYGLGTCF